VRVEITVEDDETANAAFRSLTDLIGREFEIVFTVEIRNLPVGARHLHCAQDKRGMEGFRWLGEL